MADATLDVRGLTCPLPVLKAKKALRDIPAGGTLEILATDPGAKADFEDFCIATGHSLVAYREDAGVHSFLLRRTS